MSVDVLTAVHEPYADFLPLAWQSLVKQTYRGWTWLVQIDGAPGRVAEVLDRCGAAADPRVRVHAHLTREGAAVTRNIGLGRAHAPYVQNLDADDELEPEALERLAGALTAGPGYGFAVGQARDLLPDGTLRSHPLPIRPGPIPRGTLERHWLTGPDRYAVPVHPAGVLWHRALLVRLGGWPALRGMEDTALLIAASSLATGVLVGHPTLRYRRHPEQSSTASEKFAGGGRR